METIQVTTNRGTLTQRTFKNATISSANVILSGDQLIIQDSKVISFTGRVTKKDKTDIGSFTYQNGENDPAIMPYMAGYKCEVSITSEAFASLAVEATEALQAGVVELAQEESI